MVFAVLMGLAVLIANVLVIVENNFVSILARIVSIDVVKRVLMLVFVFAIAFAFAFVLGFVVAAAFASVVTFVAFVDFERFDAVGPPHPCCSHCSCRR